MELDSRLQSNGFKVNRSGDDVVVARPSWNGEEAPTDVRVSNVRVETFHIAIPSTSAASERRSHRVMVGSHEVSPRVESSSGKDKGELALVPAGRSPSAAASSNNNNNNNVLSSSSKVKVPTLNVPTSQASQVDIQEFLKSDPIDSHPQLHPRADSLSIRARANAKLTTAELKLVASGSAQCTRCAQGFDFFRSPDRCSECKKLVCTKCSANLPYLEGLIGQESCVCTDCWSTVRAKLEVKQTELKSAEDKQRLSKELAYGDKLLSLEPEDRGNAAEKLIILELKKNPQNASLSTKELEKKACDAVKAMKACKCCNRKYDLFRRPCLCLKCSEIVCSGAACVRVVHEILEGEPFPCCRVCWPESRNALLALAARDPSAANVVDMEVSIGDRFLVDGKPGEHMHLETAFQGALKVAEDKINQRRKLEKSPRVIVSKSPRVNIDMPSRKQKSMDVVHMPQISPRADVVSPRALAVSKFTRDEVAEMASKRLVCRRCQLHFTLFRAPDKCSECGYSVCSKCSTTVPHLHELIGQEGCVCKVCWDLVRVKLLTRGRTVPFLATRCDREVALGDRLLYHEDRSTQVERVLTVRAQEAGGSKGIFGKRSEDDSVLRFVAKQTCPVCTRRFDLFRRPTLCTRCHSVVCTGAACVRVVAGGKDHICCRNCWPELHGELNKLAEATEDWAEYETLVVDIAYGDKFLLDLKPTDQIHVLEASKQALHVAQADIARRRADKNMPPLPEIPPVESIMATEGHLLGQDVSNPSTALSPRILAAQKFSPSQKEACEKGALKCARCKCKFDLFRAPDRCGQCKDAVCTKCSFPFPHLQQIMPSLSDPCVCTNCWDDLRMKVKELIETDSRAAVELALGDEILYTEPDDREDKAEIWLTDKARSHEPPTTVAEILKPIMCRHCHRKFDMWRKPVMCDQCKELCCTDLACYKYVALLKNDPNCCRGCWPNVRRDLLKKASEDPGLADEVDMERAFGDKLLLETPAGTKSDYKPLLVEALKEGRNAVATRLLGLSSTNLAIN